MNASLSLMRHNGFLVSVIMLATLVVPLRGAETIRPTTANSPVLFSDHFDEAKPGQHWRSHWADIEIKDGALKIGQSKDADHGAVLDTLIDFADIDLSFRFRFDGARQFNLVIDDRKYKGSHAGHICRVVVRPTSILLGDDKNGVMQNEVFAMRRDPKTKAAAEELLKGKSATFKANLKDDKWHTLNVIIRGDTMRVTLDDKIVGSLRSPGIAHTTKTDFGFTVPGRWVHFDDVIASLPQE